MFSCEVTLLCRKVNELLFKPFSLIYYLDSFARTLLSRVLLEF